MQVLIVDDHPLIRSAMHGVFNGITGNQPTIFEASTAGEAYEAIERNQSISLVLLDLALPDRDGLEVLAELGEHNPAIAVVVLSAHDDRQRISAALQLGAAGYIPKSASQDIMISAINLVLSGGVYVPPEFIERTDSEDSQTYAHDVSRLTKRQVEVLRLIVRGKSNKEICRDLGIAQPTVKIHVSAVLKALNVRNRTEAAFAARRLGISN